MFHRVLTVVLLLAILPLDPPAKGGVRYPLVELSDVEVTSLTLEESGDEADIFYPAPAGVPAEELVDRFPVVAFLQGALVDKQFYSEYGRRVARHGFVVVIPNHFRELVPGQGEQLFTEQEVVNDVLAQMRLEDADPSSPLFEIVDTSKLGVTGHSFGGAAGLYVVEGSCSPSFCTGSFVRPPELKAAALFGTNSFAGPFLLDVDTTAAPTAIIQGSLDGVAEPDKAQATFDILEFPRGLIGLIGLNHYGLCDINNPPGSGGDPNPSEVEQSVAYSRSAFWTGLFLRAHVLDDPFALEVLRTGGPTPTEDVFLNYQE